jgi:hydrogenase maturation factor
MSEPNCATCGDIADVMTLVRVDAGRGLGLCAADGGAHHTVELALVDAVTLGDRLLVHAGVALRRLERAP